MKNLLLIQGGDAYDLEQELSRFSKEAVRKHFVASEVKAAELEEALFSASLFSDTLVVIEEAHELTNKAFDFVMAFVKRPVLRVFLVLQARGRTDFGKLMPVVEYPEIKPWDKQAKMAEWIAGYLKQQNMKVHPQVIAELSKGGSDRFYLRQELEKLIAYVGEKKEIQLADVAAICTLESEHTLWQLTDAFMQRDTKKAVVLLTELLKQNTSPFLLIRHLRNVCQQALQMCSLAEAGVNNIHEHFDKLKGKLFDKNFKLAKEAGSAYLTKTLLAIDKTELALKDSPFDETTQLLKIFV